MGGRAIGWEVNGLRESKWTDRKWGSLWHRWRKQWSHREGKRGKCYLMAKTNENNVRRGRRKRWLVQLEKKVKGIMRGRP